MCEDAVSAVIGGASLVGGLMSSSASKDAASEQSDAANQASADQLTATRESNAMLQRQYDQSRADQAPWRSAGTGALSKLSGLLGVDTSANPGAAGQLESLRKQYQDSLTTYNNLLNSSGVAQQVAAQPFVQRFPDEDVRNLLDSRDRQAMQSSGGGDMSAINAAKAYSDSLKAQMDSLQGQSDTMAPRGPDFGEFNRKFGLADFQADPGYEFTRQQGELALDRGNAAKGRFASGAALKDLLSFNTGLANQTYNDSFNRYQTDMGNRFGRLSSLAGIGQAATNQVGQMGQSTANNIASNTMAGAAASSNALTSGAAARASGYVGSSNALSGGLNGASGGYLMSNLLGNSSGLSDPYSNRSDQLSRINSQLYE